MTIQHISNDFNDFRGRMTHSDRDRSIIQYFYFVNGQLMLICTFRYQRFKDMVVDQLLIHQIFNVNHKPLKLPGHDNFAVYDIRTVLKDVF